MEPLVVREAGGEVHAPAGRCSHMAGPLAEGDIDDGRVRCPWPRQRLPPVGQRERPRPGDVAAAVLRMPRGGRPRRSPPPPPPPPPSAALTGAAGRPASRVQSRRAEAAARRSATSPR
ncbi:Rieske 2Fe-2S domain-containing protein [Streptomyces globosus]|uniref:Rieske 2Fe-2S domain-containing protein n=1 Tax=Streptomyces globosus TaxID=68209 RepID=UPI0031D3589B